MTIPFTATTASLESRFMPMKRNCFTKRQSDFMPARTFNVISHGIQSITQTHFSLMLTR